MGSRYTRLVIILAGILVGSVIPARAQEGKHANGLTWIDAPLVPVHRSEADWLLDVGRQSFSELYGPFPTHEYTVGDQENLIPLGPSEDAAPEPFVLRYRSEHAYFWFEQYRIVDETAMEATAHFFENHIWPLNHSIYGDEWNPGIDGDSRIHIVNQEFIAPTVVGAFNPEDQCPQTLCPTSNQREIIYLNLDIAPLNSTLYLTTLAHEQQHLIQHHVDGNEQRWFNEGLSQLAEHLNGFDPGEIGSTNVRDFLLDPDNHLNGWTTDDYEIGRYYGASYLFLTYLYERLGLDFIRQVVSSPYDGLAGVQHALIEMGIPVSVDDVFGDWILANYLDTPFVGSGHYYYQTLDLPDRIRPQVITVENDPAQVSGTVNQYGADYLQLREPGTYEISFDGSDQAAVIDAVPYSGDWMWWSYNNSSSAARLTGAFDLSALAQATLTFRAWWDIEDDYDWFQVLVSTDNGGTWEIVGGPHAADHGIDAPGLYYSGDSNGWIDEQIDLSAYVGGPVLIRFEYLTDGSSIRAGVALDSLGIPELGFVDEVEDPVSVWSPDGFLRIPATVPQNWTVSVIHEPPDGVPTVDLLALDPLNATGARITVPEGGSATVVIGAMAPFTDHPASYKITVQRE